MEKVIAVGIDFSDQSEVALRHALELARQLGAGVEMIHTTYVYAMEDATLNYADLYREHQARVRGRLEQLRERYSGQGVTISHSMIDGRPTVALADAAAERGARLIAVGTHGRTGVARFFLGSVAEALVRRSPIDVLVARAGGSEGRYRRILVPTDFSAASEKALEAAIELAPEGAEIELLHCWQVPEPVAAYSFPTSSLSDYRAEVDAGARALGQVLVERYDRDGISLSFESLESPPRVGIVERAEGHDLIAIGSVGRGRLKRLFLGSTAAGVVRHAPCSVLLTRAAED